MYITYHPSHTGGGTQLAYLSTSLTHTHVYSLCLPEVHTHVYTHTRTHTHARTHTHTHTHTPQFDHTEVHDRGHLYQDVIGEEHCQQEESLGDKQHTDGPCVPITPWKGGSMVRGAILVRHKEIQMLQAHMLIAKEIAISAAI